MAETAEGREKTEPATPKRIAEARQRGQVAKSMDVTIAAKLLLGTSLLFIYLPMLSQYVQNFFKEGLRKSFTYQLNLQSTEILFRDTVFFLAKVVLPFIVVVFFIIVIAEVFQVGLHIATKKFTKGLNFKTIFNPFIGLKRMFFSGRSYFELLKSLLKLGILGFIVYSVLKKYVDSNIALIGMPIIEMPRILYKASLEIILKVGAVYILIAIADRIYQRYKYREDLKMTKEEVKEEVRQHEGDPLVKSRIRSLMRQKVRTSMLRRVQQAEVVVTNPTHFAVALEYKPERMSAPVVVAKGVDFLALKIREIAEENDIPIVEKPPLAQALYYSVDVNQEIPESLFKAVAQVLAYVYHLKQQVN